MTVKQVNIALWSVTAALSATAVGVIIAGVAKPLRQIEPNNLTTRSSLPTGPAKTEAIDSAPLLETIYVRSFRPNFQNDGNARASMMTPAPASDGAAAQDIQLIGTIGESLAILRGPDGTDAIAEVGDDVNGQVITAIHPMQIDLKTSHGVVTLRRAPEASPADVKIGP